MLDANKDNTGDQEEKIETKRKRARTCTSKVWNYFTKVGLVDGKEKCKCNACGQLYAYASSSNGTFTLHRYLGKCQQHSKFTNIGTMLLDH